MIDIPLHLTDACIFLLTNTRNVSLVLLTPEANLAVQNNKAIIFLFFSLLLVLYACQFRLLTTSETSRGQGSRVRV